MKRVKKASKYHDNDMYIKNRDKRLHQKKQLTDLFAKIGAANTEINNLADSFASFAEKVDEAAKRFNEQLEKLGNEVKKGDENNDDI